MHNQKNFRDFPEKALRENEEKYGSEIRQRYGDDTVNASYAKIRGMSEEKMQQAEALRRRIEEKLSEAFAQGDPAGETAQEVCALHKQWLCIFWPEGMYTGEAHMGLAEMYVQDARFRANYDKIAPGCTEFLRDAIRIFCAK